MPHHRPDPRALPSVLRVTILLGVVLGGTLLLPACGNKGPLYLPSDAPITEIGSSNSAAREQGQERGGTGPAGEEVDQQP